MVKQTSFTVKPPVVLLPSADINWQKWSVIACDQYTSNRKYWEEVHRFVGEQPSTLNLILPEVYLEDPDVEIRLKQIKSTMTDYLQTKLLTPLAPGYILIDRQTPQVSSRKGLLAVIDLEQFDYRSGAKSIIRSTEETIAKRLPPRIKIRQGAVLELPHILLLLDDPEQTVIEPLFQQKAELQKIYDFDLMMKGGHLTGYHLTSPALSKQINQALTNLAAPTVGYQKYGIQDDPLLLAVGDGNHSLATAKACWEDVKSKTANQAALSTHPARYCLVEIINLYDEGLSFHPIHRILFNTNPADFFNSLQTYYDCRVEYAPAPAAETLPEGTERFSFVTPAASGTVTINNPRSNLVVGSLQIFLDHFLANHSGTNIDYVHGDREAEALGRQPGNIGLLLPALNKHEFFKTVILDGALPRKTFSLGEADEKRFYLEARKIL